MIERRAYRPGRRNEDFRDKLRDFFYGDATAVAGDPLMALATALKEAQRVLELRDRMPALAGAIDACVAAELGVIVAAAEAVQAALAEYRQEVERLLEG